MDLSAIESILTEKITGSQPVGGGCIAYTRLIRTESGKEYFLKTGNYGDVFVKEAHGLKELARPEAIRIPEVIAATEDFILMEYIRPGVKHPDFFESFGRRLARQHRFCSGQFGFYEDNYIGKTLQPNVPEGNEATEWPVFYLQKRLLFQFRLAEKNGYITSGVRRSFSKLESKIAAILKGSEEEPCLLHGDLWNGNFICDEQGNAVMIDPAVYYGHREADLAMTRLFGGFPPVFYHAYQQEYPLKNGWEYRDNIYRLYHVLNHLNMFGTGYLSETKYLISGYL